MNDPTTLKIQEAQTQTGKDFKIEAENSNKINLKPLPQNRPIAGNVSTESSDELMGYLD